MGRIITGVLLILLAGCDIAPPAPQASAARLGGASFVAVSTDPIVESGDFFAGSHWNDPHVLVENGTFVMYASSPLSAANTTNIGIFRFTSANGRDWTLSPTTPVLDSSAVAWAGTAVETPSVARFGDTYHLFFTGYTGDGSVSTNYRIGHATSSDGITFTAAATPLLAPSGTVTDFHGAVVAEPGAIVVGGELRVYFSGIGFHADIDDADSTPGSTVQTIGVIRSSDATTWSAPEQVLRPDQTLHPRQIGGTDRYYGYSTPAPAILGDEVVLLFDIVDENTPGRGAGWRQVGITYATSSNGLTGWARADEAIYGLNDFAWAYEEMRAPALVATETTLYLWYAGHRFTGTPGEFILGIGLSTAAR